MQTYINMILEDRKKITQEMEVAMAPFRRKISEADAALKALGYEEKKDPAPQSASVSESARASVIAPSVTPSNDGKPSVFSAHNQETKQATV